MLDAGDPIPETAGHPVRGRLVLASRSPRRRALLAERGIDHDAVEPPLDDGELTPGAGCSPSHWVASLAYLKARATLDELEGELESGAVVLGADTVCVVGRKVVGQPRDEAEAREMIGSLGGARHWVLTGVALLGVSDRSRRLIVDRADVEVGDLEPEQIDRYVASGAWEGKAGGYNLADRIEAGWPIRFMGDPSTVMGLPMGRLASWIGPVARSEPDPSGKVA